LEVNGLHSLGVKPKQARLKQYMKKNFFFKSSLVAAVALLMTACTAADDNPVVPETADLDITARVSTTNWNFNEASSMVGWAGTPITTSDGRETALAEVYHGSADGIAETGVLMQQTLDVDNGNYVVELYANSFFTPDRGFESDMADGAEDVAYVFANDVKKFIVSKIGTAFNESGPGLYTINVKVTDGKLALGLGKEKAGTNWHSIQIKSLIQKDAPVVKPDPKDDEPGDVEKTDFTELVATNGWGGPACAIQYAPAVETADGRTAQMMENYVHGMEEDAKILLQQTIEGLPTGTYIVELYANAFYTPNRGFDSPMADGATDVAYVFANDVKKYIVGQIAESTDKNGEYSMEVNVTDGTLTLGLGKDKAGTNWHTIQIKSLTLNK